MSEKSIKLIFWSLLGLFLTSLPVAADEWQRLEGCRLVDNPANDGDSFHVRHRSEEYLIRLYFVDAPETDDRFPKRVKEQAEYFETDVERVMHFGEAATRFTEDLLKRRSFTVHTRYEDARGASKMQRLFGMIEVDRRLLSELLVEQGLARVYGVGRDLPNGTPKGRYWRHLEQLEKDAKWKKAGLWGEGARTQLDLTDDEAIQVVVLKRRTGFYTDGNFPTFRGSLAAESTVHVLSVIGDMVRVRAEFRGQVEVGHCRKVDLGL